MNINVTKQDRRPSETSDRASRIAPFAVLRTATLPLAAIERLRLPETEARLDDIAAAERAMEAQRETVERTLRDLVPQLDGEKKLRRRVINLNRDVHNGRGAKLTDEVIGAIAARIAPADRAAFETWCTAAKRHRATILSLDDIIAEELQTTLRPALRAPLDTPHFARAVELASPRTAKMAAKEKKLPKTAWPDKLERSLLGYIARASVKTSPFSSFMSVSTLGVDPVAQTAAPAAVEPDFRSFAGANRGISAQFARLSREAVVRARGTRLTVNPTLRPVRGGRFVALCTEDTTMGGRGWSEQRLAQFRLSAALGEALEPGRSDDWKGWTKRLAAADVPEAQADKMVSTLLTRGVLTVPPVTDVFTADPLSDLAAQWREGTTPDLAEAADEIDTLQTALDGFGTAQGPDRLARLATAEATVENLSDHLAANQRKPEPLTNAVTEDCWLGSAEGTLGGALLEPLADLEDFLSSQVAMAPAYTRLVKAFTDNYGAGGTCDEVIEFLTGAAPHLVDIPEFGAKLDETAPDAAPEGARIPLTAHLQIARDAKTGKAEFVMNRVFDGAGWLAARFTRTDHPHAVRLSQSLKAWLATVAEGAEPVDLPVAGQASDLQAHRPVTRRVLDWPGEPLTVPQDRRLDAASLRLHHDPSTGLLSVTDATGRPVSLQYLGNTFPNPAWGVRYALSILSRPFAVARPMPDVPGLGGDNAEPVHYRPARRHGRVMLSRPAWWISSAYLRDTWFNGTLAEQLLAVARDAERIGLPQQVYAQIHVPMQNASLVSQSVLDANRKPIWVDLRNPFWLSMLERLTRKSDWVMLSPPCPGPDDLWFDIAGEKHVTEIHLEMLVRAGKRRSATS